MEVQSWHLVVVVALFALIVWGLVAATRKTLLGLAAALVAFSGFALHTLVLEEEVQTLDLNAWLDTAGFISIPLLLAIGIVLALRRTANRA